MSNNCWMSFSVCCQQNYPNSQSSWITLKFNQFCLTKVHCLISILNDCVPGYKNFDSEFIFFIEPINWDLVSRLACHRLLRCLHGGWLGVFVRGWWGSLPTRSSQHVERIVQSHVSPLLIASQLSGVSKQQNSIPNIEVIFSL